ncbi:MAG: hypothetical protein JRG92_22575 [Deltaproteobacteria bacterium]|nr:hypothetical protein [Deltaproteobacteria bacterium]MBW2386425.1 hypothetical protein [Deltaproteobacteria bacterium]
MEQEGGTATLTLTKEELARPDFAMRGPLEHEDGDVLAHRPEHGCIQ